MDRAEKERKWQEVIDDLDAEKRNSRCGTVNECLGKDKCDYHNTNGPKDLCSWLCTDILDIDHNKIEIYAGNYTFWYIQGIISSQNIS